MLSKSFFAWIVKNGAYLFTRVQSHSHLKKNLKYNIIRALN